MIVSMITNFKIISFTEIEFNGKELDLHNNYSFVSVSTNEIENQVIIHFEKAKGNWVPANEFQRLTFTLSTIHYLKLIDPEPACISDDSCLAEITFFNSVDREENYAFTNQLFPHPGDDIIFTFESDRVIRVNCEEVIVSGEE
jgi:hypothetical protein